jgi:hypothetical protein
MTSPTQRSLAKLRGDGWTCAVVEHWNQFAHIRLDLFGCIDIVAVRVGNIGVLGVQATSGSNVSARVTKIKAEARAGIWLAAGNKLQVWGWAKVGARGERKLWSCRVVDISDTAKLEAEPALSA